MTTGMENSFGAGDRTFQARCAYWRWVRDELASRSSKVRIPPCQLFVSAARTWSSGRIAILGVDSAGGQAIQQIRSCRNAAFPQTEPQDKTDAASGMDSGALYYLGSAMR